MWKVLGSKINCLNKKNRKFSTIICQMEKSGEIRKSCSKDKKQLVIIQAYSTRLRLLCISEHRNQLGWYKTHWGHYAKPFGIAKLSFCRVGISLVLSQEFSKLHFKECFKIKLSSYIWSFSGSTVPWTQMHNVSLRRVVCFLVCVALRWYRDVFFWQWLWCLLEGMWAIRKLWWRVGKALLVHNQLLKCHQTQIF